MNKKLIVLFFAMITLLYLYSECRADVPLLSAKFPAKNIAHPSNSIPRIEIRQPAAGRLDFLCRKKYYAFTLQKPCRIRLNIKSPTKKSAHDLPYVRLYNDKFEELALRSSVRRDQNALLPQLCLPAGTYYASVCKTSPFTIKSFHFTLLCLPS